MGREPEHRQLRPSPGSAACGRGSGIGPVRRAGATVASDQCGVRARRWHRTSAACEHDGGIGPVRRASTTVASVDRARGVQPPR
jgi:hypothetical protein